jgi:hypothetical protein
MPLIQEATMGFEPMIRVLQTLGPPEHPKTKGRIFGMTKASCRPK